MKSNMKNTLGLVLLVVVAIAGCKPTQVTTTASKTEQTSASTEEVLQTLAADDMAGRKPGEAGMEKATVYVESFLRNAGVKPYYGTSFRDTMNLSGVETYNVVGLIGDKNNGKPTLMLGAHLDHIGTKKSGADTVYNGANDNASGVTAVLQLAAKLAKEPQPYNIIVALFTAEESGLQGSKHLAKRMKEEGAKLEFMLNFEMIGVPMAGQPDKVYLTGFEDTDMAAQLNKAAGQDWVVFLPAEIQYQLFRRSDNYPFYQQMNIPAQTISTFDFKNYNYYHQLEDEAQRLDPEHMDRVIDLSYKALKSMMDNKAKVSFSEIELDVEVGSPGE